jgi:1,4-dihydroxy-2-naphthoate octaprenyltransferase
MNIDAVRPGLTQRWLMAARPKTLPAATVPVIVGTAAAFKDNHFQAGPALAALIGALLIQIGANFANDVFDYKKGADTTERLGPTRVTQAGMLTPAQVYLGMLVVFGLAMLVGVYLVLVAGWAIILIGLFSIAAALAYTGGPFPLGYNGLGDLFVFIFFGLIAVCGTYFVQAGTVGPLAWWCALPVGFLATAILVVNNLRDVKTDQIAGKRTLAVRLGERGVRAEYALLVLLSFAVPPVIWLAGITGPAVMLAWLSAPLAWPLWQTVAHLEGRILNKALAGTARLELVYGILLAAGLVISRL